MNVTAPFSRVCDARSPRFHRARGATPGGDSSAKGPLSVSTRSRQRWGGTLIFARRGRRRRRRTRTRRSAASARRGCLTSASRASLARRSRRRAATSSTPAATCTQSPKYLESCELPACPMCRSGQRRPRGAPWGAALMKCDLQRTTYTQGDGLGECRDSARVSERRKDVFSNGCSFGETH